MDRLDTGEGDVDADDTGAGDTRTDVGDTIAARYPNADRMTNTVQHGGDYDHRLGGAVQLNIYRSSASVPKPSNWRWCRFPFATHGH